MQVKTRPPKSHGYKERPFLRRLAVSAPATLSSFVQAVTQIPVSIEKLKDWMKTGKSRSKLDVAEYYICRDKASAVMAPVMWVSCQRYHTHLQNGKTLIVSFLFFLFFLPLCLPSCSSFIIWAARDEFAIIKLVLRRQWREETDKIKYDGRENTGFSWKRVILITVIFLVAHQLNECVLCQLCLRLFIYLFICFFFPDSVLSKQAVV